MAEFTDPNSARPPDADYRARDYASLLESMRARIPEIMPEWRDFESEADFGNALLQLFAHAGDILSYYQDRALAEAFLATARSRRSLAEHLRLIGYSLATAAPATANLRLLIPADCDETIIISEGDSFGTESEEGESVVFEYVDPAPLRIDARRLPVDPETGKKIFDGVPVEEGERVSDELLGYSDGSPDQRFALLQDSVILKRFRYDGTAPGDVKIWTKHGEIVEAWTRRDTLAFSRNGARDFVVEIDEDERAEIIFGNQKFGAIPLRDAEIHVSYRSGGGARGNAGRRSITAIVDAPQLARLGVEVTNPGPATGGEDRESPETAALIAPALFRSRDRAVTAADFFALALAHPGVGKARAAASGINTISLYVAPAGGGQLTDALRRQLLAYFEDRRLLTSTVEVEDVDYVRIYVSVTIGVASFYSVNSVRERAIVAVGELLAFEKVDFGQTLFLSKIYQAIEAIDGVLYATVTEFRREDQAPGTITADGRLLLGPNEIARVPNDPDDDPVYARGVNVTANEGAA